MFGQRKSKARTMCSDEHYLCENSPVSKPRTEQDFARTCVRTNTIWARTNVVPFARTAQYFARTLSEGFARTALSRVKLPRIKRFVRERSKSNRKLILLGQKCIKIGILIWKPQSFINFGILDVLGC